MMKNFISLISLIQNNYLLRRKFLKNILSSFAFLLIFNLSAFSQEFEFPIAEQVREVTMKVFVTCALTKQDNLYCFGRNNRSQVGNNKVIDAIYPNFVLANVIKADVGYGHDHAHSCAIKKDGTLWCWGYNIFGQIGNGTVNDGNIPSIVEGELEGKEVTELSLGENHTCVITSENKNNLYCFGDNASGQIGNGGVRTKEISPYNVLGELENKKVIKVVLGFSHTCVITNEDNNNLYCWGKNTRGQIGNGNTQNQMLPFNIQGELLDKKVIDVELRDSNTCAITNEDKGNLYCFGINAQGQLGNGNKTTQTLPSKVIGDLVNKKITSVKIGWHHTCGITSDSSLYCFGRNNVGQLGKEDISPNTSIPVKILDDISSLHTSFNHTCAITNDSNFYCFGNNDFGQVGNGNDVDQFSPTQVLSDKSVKTVTTSYLHTCAITNDGALYCFGGNGFGQLGANKKSYNSLPTLVGGVLEGKSVEKFSSGLAHNCVLTNENTDNLYCFGDNNYGDLGDSTFKNKQAPIKPSGLEGKKINSISLYGQHSCVITDEKKLYCFGRNDKGQVGDNSSSENKPLPVLVQGLDGKEVIDVKSGVYYTCAITNESVNNLYCFGNNDKGQLGIGNLQNKNVATKVVGLEDKFVEQVKLEVYYTCALTSDKKLYCFGANNYGQVGCDPNDEGCDNQKVLTAMPILKDKQVQKFVVGTYHACLITNEEDNNLYCFGFNKTGAIGSGDTTNVNRIKCLMILKILKIFLKLVLWLDIRAH